MNFTCVFVWHRSCSRQEASLATGKVSLFFVSQNCHSEWEMASAASKFDLSFPNAMSCRLSTGLQPYALYVYLITLFCLVYFTSNVYHADKLVKSNTGPTCDVFCYPSWTRKYKLLHGFCATKIYLLFWSNRQWKRRIIDIKTQANLVYFCWWWIWQHVHVLSHDPSIILQLGWRLGYTLHVACAIYTQTNST